MKELNGVWGSCKGLHRDYVGYMGLGSTAGVYKGYREYRVVFEWVERFKDHTGYMGFPKTRGTI